MKVFVYYNLHKHLWSIKALEGANKGKVIGHRQYVSLVEAVPKVSEAGRQRVLREKRKNVHAGIVGHINEDATLEHYMDNLTLNGYHVSYNPYKADGFVYTDAIEGFDKWEGSPVVLMNATAKRKVMAFDEGF